MRKAVVLLLFIYCYFLLLLFVRVLCLVLVLLCSTLCPTSFAIDSFGNREVVALLSLSSWCHVAVNVLCLFLTVPSVSLHSVILVFPGHTHLHFLC